MSHTASLLRARAEYIAAMQKAVAAQPEAYKESVRNDPVAHAIRVIAGLDRNEVDRLARELRAETRLITGARSHEKKSK